METMLFMRGDVNHHSFGIPADAWSAGGRLFFAAKQAIDDDNTDAKAVIQGNWDDTVVSNLTVNGVAYKLYTCDFPASATNSIQSGGAETMDFLGEFQWVPAGGADPVTAPAAGDDRIPVTLYFDVKRKTTP